MVQSPLLNTGNYRNIIFDIGAVLVQWNPHFIVSQLFKERTQIPYELVQATKSPAWLEFDRGTLTQEELITSIANSSSIPLNDVALFVEQSALFLTPLELGTKMFFAAKQQRLGVYLLTNISFYSLHHLQQTTPFFKEADGFIASCEVKSVKPEAAIYKHLLDKYHLNPKECLFIDDLEANIKAGNELGIDGIVCQDHQSVINQLNNKGIIIV